MRRKHQIVERGHSRLVGIFVPFADYTRCALPAMRALQVEPMTALRSESPPGWGLRGREVSGIPFDGYWLDVQLLRILGSLHDEAEPR